MNKNKPMNGYVLMMCVLLVSLMAVNCKNESTVLLKKDQLQSVLLFNTGNIPVLTDGIFSEGEWADALSVPIHESVILFFKRMGEYVFIGIKCDQFIGPAIDLFVSSGDGKIHQLHISAQLGERVLSSSSVKEDGPVFSWGYTKDWYANEVRWDENKLQYIMKMEKKTRMEAFADSAYRFDGVEMQIRQKKFVSNEWLLRLEIWYPPVFKTPFIFPEASSKEDTNNWIKLKLMD